MIATMLELQNATQEAVHDEIIMNMASAIYHHKDEMSSDEFARALFEYSAALSAMTTTLVTHVLLTESQLSEMIETIREFDELGKDINNGNN
ncbi:MAG: hypothetical protein EBV71_03975 [Chitinophagia bacterium]|jgi:hypothetical protein|nr:hypothetical protein [Chitinophagia bacterium]NDE79234.1 hypothetical protein [Chitinophagaceae bacterium]